MLPALRKMCTVPKIVNKSLFTDEINSNSKNPANLMLALIYISYNKTLGTVGTVSFVFVRILESIQGISKASQPLTMAF